LVIQAIFVLLGELAGLDADEGLGGHGN
jgi:hypothetical protein